MSSSKLPFFGLLFVVGLLFSQQKKVQMPPWQEGMLDIHHINTGRGDAAFLYFPTVPHCLLMREICQKPDRVHFLLEMLN